MLRVNNICKSYNKQQILKGVSFEIKRGECLGIIGESGSGKSTLGRIILGIEKTDSGEVLFNEENINKHLGKIGSVFQDYTSSINPRFTVFDAIAEPILITKGYKNKDNLRKKVIKLIEQVGLDETYLNRYPHELSGGQAQRVCIARAISTEPEFILLDEAISSLDVSVQTQVLNLLLELKEKYNIGYLFITHDIQAVTYICDRVIFFFEGQIVESSTVDKLSKVKEAYSKKLLSVVMPF